MHMRFTIEQKHLTDAAGKPISHLPNSTSFHSCVADSADDAVRMFIKRDHAELLGEILRLPGFHAIATVRKIEGVYTLQAAPSSQDRPVESRDEQR